MAVYTAIKAPKIEKEAIVVELKVLEAVVSQYGTPHFVTKNFGRHKTNLHFTFLPCCRPIIAYEE